jgi:hypothetical protein
MTNTQGEPQAEELLKLLHERQSSSVRIDVGPFTTLLRRWQLKGGRFDTIEEIQAESQRVPDAVIENDFQEAFQKRRRRWDRCLHAGGNTSRVTVANRPYGEFYDFYSVSLKNFGYLHVYKYVNIQGVPGVKVNISGFNSRADAESKTSYTHGSNLQRFRSYEF